MTEFFLLLGLLGLVIVYLYLRGKAVDDIFALVDRDLVVFNGDWPVAVDNINVEDHLILMRSREILFPFGFGKRKALGIYSLLTKYEVNAVDSVIRHLPALVSDSVRLSAEEKNAVLDGQKALRKLLKRHSALRLCVPT